MKTLKKPRGEAAIQQIVKPVFDAIDQAKAPTGGEKGVKISHREALTIDRATTTAARRANRALAEKRISPDDAFMEVPARMGMGMMQSLQAKDFVSKRDFNKLWDLAVDFVSADPNAVQALVD
jgi:hypothetical protein